MAAPSRAERALLESVSTGTLCTLSREPAGYPYDSLVTYGLEPNEPVLLTSTLAGHKETCWRTAVRRCSFRDLRQTLGLVTDVLWITGVVVAGFGVTLFVLDATSDEKTQSTVQAGCFDGGCGLRASGRF